MRGFLVRFHPMAPVLLLWGLSVALAPVYLLPSGAPQPADALALAFALVCLRLLPKRLDAGLAAVVPWVLAAMAWAAMVNLAWAVMAEDASMARAPAYYLFNGTVFLAFLLAASHDRTRALRATDLALTVAVALVVVGLVARGGILRNTAWFNSPNQLGYYGVLAAAMAAMAADAFGWTLRRTAVYAGAVLAAVASLSFAAAGAVVLVTLWALRGSLLSWRRWGAMVAAVGLVMVGALLWAEAGSTPGVWEAWEQRTGRLEQKLSDPLTTRGYDRIWRHPEHLVLGAGEGGRQRFETGRELHSTPGTVLFSYGLVGVALAGVFAWRVVALAGLLPSLLFAAPLFYGLTHQGLRFTPLWVMTAFFLAVYVVRPSPVARSAP